MNNLLSTRLEQPNPIYAPWIRTSDSDVAFLFSNIVRGAAIIDMRSGSMSFETAATMAHLLSSNNVPAIIRLNSSESKDIGSGIVAGACGIIFSGIETPESAERLRGNFEKAAKAILPMENVYGSAEKPLLILQIDTWRAFSTMETLLRVSFAGIALLDLAGITKTAEGKGGEAYSVIRQFARVCRGNDVFPAAVVSKDDLREYIDAGYRILLGGSDVSFIRNGIRQYCDEFRCIAAKRGGV